MDVATVQVATAVLISAITAPLVAAWFLKRNGTLSNPDELEAVSSEDVDGSAAPSRDTASALEKSADVAERTAPAANRDGSAAPTGSTTHGRRRGEPRDS